MTRNVPDRSPTWLMKVLVPLDRGLHHVGGTVSRSQRRPRNPRSAIGPCSGWAPKPTPTPMMYARQSGRVLLIRTTRLETRRWWRWPAVWTRGSALLSVICWRSQASALSPSRQRPTLEIQHFCHFCAPSIPPTAMRTPRSKHASACNHLRVPRESFLDRLTHYFAEVNAIHPFREGNGRAQRAFFRLNRQRITRDSQDRFRILPR